MFLRALPHTIAQLPLNRSLLLVSIVAAVCSYFLLPELLLSASGVAAEATPPMRLCVALSVLSVLLFILRPLPIWLSSLLLFVLFSSSGLIQPTALFEAYSSEFILILASGMLLAAELRYRKIDTRLALWFLQFFGPSRRSLLFNGMALSGFLSMWISNGLLGTILLPVVVSFLKFSARLNRLAGEGDSKSFSTLFTLGLAFSITIGGLSNITGHPANLALYRFFCHAFGSELNLLTWFMMGLLFFCLGIPCAYFILSRRLHVSRSEAAEEALFFDFLAEEHERLPRPTRSDKLVGLTLLLAVFTWTGASLLELCLPESSAVQLYANSLATFLSLVLIAAIHLTDPRFNSRKMALSLKAQPWWILLFLGSSFTLASALDTTGLAVAIASHAAFFLHIDTYLSLTLMALALVIVGNFLPTVVLGTLCGLFFSTLFASVSHADEQWVIALTLLPSASFLLPTGSLQSMIFYTTKAFRFREFAAYGALVSLLLIPLLLLLPRCMDRKYITSSASETQLYIEKQNAVMLRTLEQRKGEAALQASGKSTDPKMLAE